MRRLLFLAMFLSLCGPSDARADTSITGNHWQPDQFKDFTSEDQETVALAIGDYCRQAIALLSSRSEIPRRVG